MKELLFVLLLASCSKENDTDKVCYRCEFGTGPNGQVYPAKDTCFDPWIDVGKYQFTDKDGNDMSSLCTKK